MKHNHARERIEKMCEILGEDFNSPVCQLMLEQIQSCPTCKVYFDTVKKTVLLCRENDCPEELPADVHQRLMKILDLPVDKTGQSSAIG